MLYFGAWNSEVFSAITGLVGAITGIFVSRRARKIFSEEGFETSPVPAKKLGKKSVQIQKPPTKHPQATYKISLRLNPDVKRYRAFSAGRSVIKYAITSSF